MPGFFQSIFGGEKEYHKDGSSTERFSDGDVIVRDPDGNTLEWSTVEQHNSFNLLSSAQDRVTYDGNGNEINRQELKSR